MTDAILEAATQAVQRTYHPIPLTHYEDNIIRVVLAAVTPLIEEAALKRWHHDLAYVKAAALEEAAKVAEDGKEDWVEDWVVEQIAASIRALKEQP